MSARDAEVEALLAGQQSVALVGPVDSGKRALVEQLAQHADPQVIFVVLDCAALADGDGAQFFERCAMVLNTACSQRGIQLAVPHSPHEPMRLVFEGILRQIQRSGLQVVLALVALEHLAANPKINVGLFNALRSASGRLPLTFLTTSQLPLIDLTYAGDAEAIRSSPFFNIFAQIRMA